MKAKRKSNLQNYPINLQNLPTYLGMLNYNATYFNLLERTLKHYQEADNSVLLLPYGSL